MGRFQHVVAAPALQLFEKGLLGKRFVRLSRLYIVIGMYLFEQGGALGYSLRGQPALLGKLLGFPPEEATEGIRDIHAIATSCQERFEGEEHGFFDLYVVPELERLGIDIRAYPPSKDMDKKVDQKTAYTVMVMAFLAGAALGYHFPDRFKRFSEYHYRPVPNSEWQRHRAAGLELPEMQEPRSLEEAVGELAASAAEWATEEAPELLSSSEIDLLNSLAANAPNAT